jgi:hypothetical protein
MEKLKDWGNGALYLKVNEIIDYLVEEKEHKKKLLKEFEKIIDRD